MSNQSRRNFVKSAGLVAGSFGLAGVAKADNVGTVKKVNNKTRQIYVATITQGGIGGNDCHEAIQMALKQMEFALPFSPDIICLPEVFHVAGLKGGRPSLEVSSEDGTGNIIKPLQDFATRNNCYVICAVYTVENGKYYNAAVLVDRKGKKVGEYRKIRLTENEMNKGLTPGPLEPPVFKTDFGTIGIQICYDIEWEDGWKHLARKGAEIVFWPSAFSAGKRINTKAWENQYYVVSSTRKDASKICDINGEEIVKSGTFSPWGVCASVNLEKVFLHSWPHSRKFPAIQKKYGNKVNCYTLHEEEISVIESLSADVKVSDILVEFGLDTYRQHLHKAETRQAGLRV